MVIRPLISLINCTRSIFSVVFLLGCVSVEKGSLSLFGGSLIKDLISQYNTKFNLEEAAKLLDDESIIWKTV